MRLLQLQSVLTLRSRLSPQTLTHIVARSHHHTHTLSLCPGSLPLGTFFYNSTATHFFFTFSLCPALVSMALRTIHHTSAIIPLTLCRSVQDLLHWERFSTILILQMFTLSSTCINDTQDNINDTTALYARVC